MTAPIHHPHEHESNLLRDHISHLEPRSLRTYTPSLAVLAKSAGVFHWTPEGKRLYDFSSGVLVANLGHNPIRWMQRFQQYMGWPTGAIQQTDDAPDGYFSAVTMTAYNGITPVETLASRRLLETVQSVPGGARLQQVMWAASGSEAIQKALWTAMAFDRTRPMILATRFGFHGKKGLANAITGSEHDAERDPRVRFISFPMHESRDLTLRTHSFDPTPYRKELEALYHQYGQKIGCLVTEPYLGGGGSYHPPIAYHQMLQDFCREHDILLIFDEVQANFGRTGNLFAYTTYGVEPDMVVLGKGLGNGVPVAAVVGRRDLFQSMAYGEGSDTWSANPLCCASVLATLDEFADPEVMHNCHRSSAIIEAGLCELKSFPFVAHVRGENGGMVWGVEMQDYAGRTAQEWANAVVLAAYHGDGDDATCDGIHLLGPLSKKIVRISPPLTISQSEATDSMRILHGAISRLNQSVGKSVEVKSAYVGVN
ncbi:aspartate aminotransferase family protein [Tuwongella immobilis]|uniref:Uncharacterized protein n=1 Tax=Tuwongella immobilis TaxID=692036 RepID=A0A6C2YNC6_9BACT|nr:aminotransferase class III-fold pyridoxal phosphate-dependent enzyme [Tuwongella immobilis]VIP03118.1 4-aminobutyrate aminotransferase : 4-aminobutyrate aminotransferase OS=Planctomyces maris DSM 8797 GN=PM8797T_18644 PE=3 SV=1: Aminotran_3 [Tuwongella immobilis]VTS03442.1 4-aminobutyrate aminotransferase : 4-aminobutyrate aminotransferase OS=Planctomyces maris DSM 8797 GN=PM8797T_18644 PE=3 SV=1: Aminotran_3 [Tuwongella immobilis]